MKLSLCNIAAASLLVSLAGCGSLFSDKDNSPEPVEVPNFQPKIELEKIGSFDVDGAERNSFQPVWLKGQVWAVGRDGKVEAWSPASRDARRLEFGSELSAGLDVTDEMVLAASPKGGVIALNHDGKSRWQQTIKSEILARPRLAGELVLVRAQDGRLIALSAADGSVKWQSDVKNPALVLHAPSGLAVADNVVYAAFPGGKMRAYELASGNLLWETWVAQPKGATELERVTDVVGDPWVSGEQVCAVSFQGRIGCFGRSNGTALWTREFSSVNGLDGDHRYVYATDSNSVVAAFDKASGRQIWKQDKLFARALTRPTVFGRYVVVADYEGKVFLLDSESGELNGQADAGDEVRVPALVADEQLLIQDVDGKVSLFKLR